MTVTARSLLVAPRESVGPGRSASPRHALRPAFTLVEMVTSCAILSLLMLALGYGLKLALVSTGEGATQAAALLDSTAVIERVTDDLNEATNFTEKAGESVTFTVPRRGPTTLPAGTEPPPDEIRYKWWPAGGTVETGLAGATDALLGGLLAGPTVTSNTVPANALTRQVNGGPPAVLARDVRAFRLDYAHRTVSPPVTTVSDRLLLEHDPGLTIGTPTEFQLNTLRQMGESFKMPLSADVTSYTITRVMLYLRADSTFDGVLVVKFCPADALSNAPLVAQTIEQVWVPELAMTGSMGWVEVPFTKLRGLSPAQKYCVLITGSGSAGAYHAVAGYVRHLTPPLTSILAPNTYLVQTTNGTSPWTTSSSNSLRYKIYGTTSP